MNTPLEIKTSREKVLLHMDGDAFFVGVEVAKNPKLRGLPVVTGEERGIVSALSYEAKALGIKRGMPIFRLKKEFPDVFVLPGDYASYAKYSSAMFDIVRRFADDVEEYSIDECFADLTGLDKPLKMSYLEIAQRIKKEINKELDLSVTIGLAPTKVLAKVASKWVKPNGLTVIETKDAEKFLAKVQIENIWGIGPRTANRLIQKGIKTALDFTSKELRWVRRNFSKPYEVIWRELHGEQLLEIDGNPKSTYSSVQKTRTFHPATNDKTFLLSQLSKHVEDACRKARYYKLAPKKVTFFLKTREFKYYVGSFTLPTPTSAPEIPITLIRERFASVHKKGVLYRTTGVTLQDLVSSSTVQSDLFGDDKKTRKYEVIHGQIDKLEEKFGRNVVYLASTHKAKKRKVSGTDADDLDRDLLFL